MRHENTGHGHVYVRPDGVKARCGGPAICSECALDFARKSQEDMPADLRKTVNEATKRWSDEGRLIEAGWQAMLILSMPKDAGEVQVREMRKAFFLGAQHLYACLLNIMDADREPTEADMKRMQLVHAELEVFEKRLRESGGVVHGKKTS